jgi:hypothetical protein
MPGATDDILTTVQRPLHILAYGPVAKILTKNYIGPDN